MRTWVYSFGTMVVVIMTVAVGSGGTAAMQEGSVRAMKSEPRATAEDELNLQIVILKSQLSQAMAATAKCEAEGPSSAKTAQEANTAAKTLIESLDHRGLMVEKDTNKIVAKPSETKK